jgi:hypothetical protein
MKSILNEEEDSPDMHPGSGVNSSHTVSPNYMSPRNRQMILTHTDTK